MRKGIMQPSRFPAHFEQVSGLGFFWSVSNSFVLYFGEAAEVRSLLSPSVLQHQIHHAGVSSPRVTTFSAS